jgi:hypothetical protein
MGDVLGPSICASNVRDGVVVRLARLQQRFKTKTRLCWERVRIKVSVRVRVLVRVTVRPK